jgi:aldose 1-epimerase
LRAGVERWRQPTLIDACADRAVGRNARCVRVRGCSDPAPDTGERNRKRQYAFACYHGPYSNRIAQAVLLWNGTSHTLPRYIREQEHAIHGSAWQRAWSVIERSDVTRRRAVHRQTSRTATNAVRRVEQRFDLAADQLDLHSRSATTTRRRCRSARLASIFRANRRHRLEFCAGSVWLTDDTLLPIGPSRVPADGISAGRAIDGAAIDNCFSGWRPPARWPSRQLSVEIDASDACDHLVVYVLRARLPRHRAGHAHDRRVQPRGAGHQRHRTRTLAPGDAFLVMRFS